IMTSNLGTADLRKTSVGFAQSSGAVTYERMKAKVNEALKAHFRPEFLNRIDEIIVFHELSRDEVIQIVDLMLARTAHQLSGQGLGLELTPTARAHLAEKGYDPQLGARPLRRAIQQLVEDPLSERILWKEFHVGETVVVDLDSEPGDGEDGPHLTFKAIQGVEPPPMELAGSSTGD
ncbi:MAG: AAA family ATPase, partial [Acidimicrobiales bacterium]